MRAAIRFLGNRYGIATALAVAVLLVVGVAKLAGDNNAPSVGPDIGATAIATTEDDGLTEVVPSAEPFSGPGVKPPDKVATAFAEAWIDHVDVKAEDWLDSLRDLATPALIKKLKDTDPAGVPANRITGPVSLDIRDARLVEATIPVDSGRLVLRLIVDDNRWLIDGIDWGRE